MLCDAWGRGGWRGWWRCGWASVCGAFRDGALKVGGKSGKGIVLGVGGVGVVGEDVEEEDEGVFTGGVGFVVESVNKTVDAGSAVASVVRNEVVPG